MKIWALVLVLLCSSAVAQSGKHKWVLHKKTNPAGAPPSIDTFSEEACKVGHFTPFCQLPYDGPPRDIDKACGHCGTSDLKGNDLTAEFEQNFQKTNLCSPSDAPVLVTIEDLHQLQKQVDGIPGFKYGNIHSGGSGPPLDRSPLKDMKPVNGKTLHEGMVVRFVGFLAEEHYSPESTSNAGESVNCGANDHPNVDIHMSLLETATRVPPHATGAQKEPILCPSIGAEMIPHFRPEDWEFAQLEHVSDRQVRLTGQLFFDGSHKPCNVPGHATTDPKRIASWEIHPIYAFEVCKKIGGAACDPNKDSDWMTMDEATKNMGENEEP